MNTQPRQALSPPRMTAEEYLGWVFDQAEGRFELVDGEVVAMASERAGHARAKMAAAIALADAIRARGLDCEVFGDGMAVRVSNHAVYEPDAQVRCGPRLPDDAILVPDPVVVVEVLSPSTRAVDTGKKLTGYFSLPSVRHYLVLDPEDRSVLHYRREGSGVGLTILGGGAPDAELVLDPPGLRLRRADLFDAP